MRYLSYRLPCRHLNALHYLCSVMLILLWGSHGTESQRTAENSKLVCFYHPWATYRPDKGAFTPEYINAHLCTHVISSSYHVGEDGAIAILDAFLSFTKNDLVNFEKVKRFNSQLKLMIDIGGTGEKSAQFPKVVESPESRKHFVDSVTRFLKTHEFDGVNINWMYPGKDHKEKYLELLKDLRKEFGSQRILSITGQAWDPEDAGYDVKEITKYVDFVNVWSFDYHGAWNSYTGLIAPLFPRKDDAVPRENVAYAIKSWLNAGIDASKLIVGIPTYGRTFTLQDPSRTEIGAPVTAPGGLPGPYTKQAGLLGFNELVEYFKDPGYQFHRDPEAMVPFAHKGNLWITYEDEESVTRKAIYIHHENRLGGVMINSLDTDDFQGVNGTTSPLTFAVKKILSQERKYRRKRKIRTCTRIGELIKNPEHCSTYYSCTLNQDGSYRQVLMHCQDILGFNEDRQECDYKHKIPGCTFELKPCTREGELIRDPENCTTYYACTLNQDGSYKHTIMKCPNTLGFDEHLQQCNHKYEIPGCA